MLRNNYILPYKSKNISSLYNQENTYTQQDDNYKLFLHRPLMQSQIKKVAQEKLYKFIDNIMCNKKINNLLYSSNAKKIAKYYIKHKKFLSTQYIPIKIDEDNFFRKKAITLNEVIKRQTIMDNIKYTLENYRRDKKTYMTQIIEKDDKFLNSQPKIDKKIKILNSKAINYIKLKGYKRAFDKCLNNSLTKKKFKIINVNSNDVYGRLYNNNSLQISNRINRNNSQNKILIPKNILSENKGNAYNIRQIILKNKNLKSYKIKKNNSELDVFVPNQKKIKIYKLKSNLTRNEHNLNQFTSAITKQMINNCWKSISGGPKKSNKNIQNRNKLKEELNSKYNYTILSTQKNGDINDISLYNTIRVDDPFFRKIQVKNKNYRDNQNNSNLHIAVDKNSIKMVRYFLNKRNINLNTRNDQGQTALHLACSMGNEDMINLLLIKGADTEILDEEGKKPFDLFAERSKYSLI